MWIIVDREEVDRLRKRFMKLDKVRCSARELFHKVLVANWYGRVRLGQLRHYRAR